MPRAFSACLALACVGTAVVALAGSTTTDFPGTQTLLNASQDDANWILPAKTYSGNRYTGPTQIDKSSVGHFRECRRL